ncbi:hypothetical protein JCM19237_6730 [Photobacterium aphoticum]|uniref:Uncharacterized protein n=1 Tax=Photobacterium aphoticum TaxID=754436 RepID=A0A090QLM6_9GAMM|nr:hypothetical protein JCM19237_6730 [Photobacterium aphoticum]
MTSTPIEYNIFATGTSSYPRSVMTGAIATNSTEQSKSIFDIYVYGVEPQKVTNNITIKGYIPMDDTGHPRPTKDSGNITAPEVDTEELTLISQKIESVPDGYKVNLIIEDTFARNSSKLLTEAALERLQSITIVLEGSGALNPKSYRLMQTVNLAKQAEDFGVPEFNIQVFSSVNTDILANGNGDTIVENKYWKSILESNYITIKLTDFDSISRNINTEKEISALEKMMAAYGYDFSTAFVPSHKFDHKKKLLVFFGSSRIGDQDTEENRQGANFNNVKLLDYYLNTPEIADNYNVAVKPHPRLAWINKHIEDKGIDASYFSSMPYELLAIAGGKKINGVDIPVIDRVDSTYSTILYSVEKSKINAIIDYSPYTASLRVMSQ